MDELERQDVLDAVTPDELFGDAASDPRALRRAYARLAKHYKSDPEVFTHVRALFEAARDGAPLPARPASDHPEPEAPADEPESEADDASPHPARALHEAMQQADLQGAYDVIATAHRELIRDAPGLLEHVVHVLIEGVGSRLSESPLDVLEAVIDDPTWDLPPDLSTGWRVRIRQSRALWKAAEDPELEPLVDALRRVWSAPPHLAAPIWIELAGSLKQSGADLDGLFERLERHHPTVLGLHRIAERRMLTLAETTPVDLPESVTEPLYQRYQPSSACVEHWWIERAIRADGNGFVALRVLAFLGILALLVVNRLLGIAGGVAAYLFFESLKPNEKGARKEYERVHAEPVDPLLDVCRAHALFPRELAARVYGSAVPMKDQYAFEPTHPLYRLDRSDSALLRVIGPVHQARLEGIHARLEAQHAADQARRDAEAEHLAGERS